MLDVPATSFQSLIDRARRTGTVRSLTTSDQDVTGQVIDLGAQLTALQDERSQLEVLLSKSAKVSDLLQVEDQIESVQSQIQQIQGEQRVLSQQVAFSALTVHLAVPVVAHHKVSSTGFAHAWHVAISSFVNAVKDLVSVLGDIAFAILAALVALGIAYASVAQGMATPPPSIRLSLTDPAQRRRLRTQRRLVGVVGRCGVRTRSARRRFGQLGDRHATARDDDVVALA